MPSVHVYLPIVFTPALAARPVICEYPGRYLPRYPGPRVPGYPVPRARLSTLMMRGGCNNASSHEHAFEFTRGRNSYLSAKNVHHATGSSTTTGSRCSSPSRNASNGNTNTNSTRVIQIGHGLGRSRLQSRFGARRQVPWTKQPNTGLWGCGSVPRRDCARGFTRVPAAPL
eukprot:1604555-Rhodomonas_salina.2